MKLPLPILAMPGETTLPRRFHWDSMARGVAVFFGLLFLVAFSVRALNPRFDLSLWWLDLRAFPTVLAAIFGCVAGASMLAWGLLSQPPRWLGRLTSGVAAFAAMLAVVNAGIVGWLFATARIHGAFPFPLSLLFAALFLLVAVQARKTPAKRDGRFPEILAATLVCAGLFPVLQVFCFGWTDYQRPADVAVVFGARAYADGTPSDPLAERVERACELYRSGTVSRLYFSGGPGDGAVHETESMRRMALDLGVPNSAITADLDGLNTDATVRHSLDFAQSIHATRILAVSEFYHLPRIKLCYQSRGIDAYTVPAHPADALRAWPMHSIVREIPAYWTYLGRAAARSISHPSVLP